MINLRESMGLGRDRTCNPWICSQTLSRLRYVAHQRAKYMCTCTYVFLLQGKEGRDEQLKKLQDHLLQYYISTNKRWIVLFPEGGFLYKRRQRSQE